MTGPVQGAVHGRYDFHVELFDPRGHAVVCVIRAQDLIELNPGNVDVVAVLDGLVEEPDGNFDLDRFVVSRPGRTDCPDGSSLTRAQSSHGSP